jgi:hypothetical protein
MVRGASNSSWTHHLQVERTGKHCPSPRNYFSCCDVIDGVAVEPPLGPEILDGKTPEALARPFSPGTDIVLLRLLGEYIQLLRIDGASDEGNARDALCPSPKHRSRGTARLLYWRTSVPEMNHAEQGLPSSVYDR